MPALLIIVGVLGLAVGSFLNVVVHRVPRAMSLSRPGSHCPACGRAVRHRHNVPVVGWLVLRGRCAHCRTRISARYPIVELTTAVLFVVVTARLADLGLWSALPAFLWFAALGLALALIDLDVRRLPDALTLPAYPVLGLLLVVAAWVAGDPAAVLRAAGGVAASLGFYYLLAIAKPGAMGWGDVKTAGLVGGMLAFISWPVLLVGTLAAFLIGSAYGLAAMARGRATRTSTVPFGPFMLLGALLALLAGAPVADLYRHLLLPS